MSMLLIGDEHNRNINMNASDDSIQSYESDFETNKKGAFACFGDIGRNSK